MTNSETILWETLRDRRLLGLKFRRQHAVGRFVLDFYCAELRLAIEVDGGIHLDPEQANADRLRQAEIEENGIRFVRLTADQVEHDINGTTAQLIESINNLTPPDHTTSRKQSPWPNESA